MFIHVQRENGLAHRSLVLHPWQVQAVRVLTSRWFVLVLGLAMVSWGIFAVQAVRVPLLTSRIRQLEADRQRLDTLQQALVQLQTRYDQVQHMLSTTGKPAETKDKRKR